MENTLVYIKKAIGKITIYVPHDILKQGYDAIVSIDSKVDLKDVNIEIVSYDKKESNQLPKICISD